MKPSTTPPDNLPPAPAVPEPPPARWIPLLTWEQAARLLRTDPVLDFEPGTFSQPTRSGQL